MLVCRVQDLGGSRLRARVMNGRWAATLCRPGGPGVNVEFLGGRETPIPGDWRVSHAIEMDEGAARLADVGDYEGLLKLALMDLQRPGLFAAA